MGDDERLQTQEMLQRIAALEARVEQLERRITEARPLQENARSGHNTGNEYRQPLAPLGLGGKSSEQCIMRARSDRCQAMPRRDVAVAVLRTMRDPRVGCNKASQVTHPMLRVMGVCAVGPWVLSFIGGAKVF